MQSAAKVWVLDRLDREPGAAAAPPAKRLRTGGAAVERAIETARSLGLLGELGVSFGPMSAAETALFEAQRQACWRSMDLPRMETMMRWLGGFMEHARLGPKYDRPLFVPALSLEGQVRNRLVLDCFGRWIRQSTPLSSRGGASGAPVSGDTISSYVGSLRLLRCREARYDIAPESVDMSASLGYKDMAKSDPHSGGQRKLRRALRHSMFVLAAQRGFDRHTQRGAVRWSAGHSMTNLVLRGGEGGCQDGADITDIAVYRRVLRFSSFKFMSPVASMPLRLWAMVEVIPIKDPKCNFRPFPTPLVRCHDGAYGDRPDCPYDALVAAWWARRALPTEALPLDAFGRPADGWWRCEAARRQAPGCADSDFFYQIDGRVWRTADSRELAREIAALANPEADASEWGASSFRSGGATDLLSRHGAADARARLDRRGRWGTDIGDIYARTTAAAEMQSSLDISLAVDEDLETVARGWVQPARTFGRA